MKKKLFGFLRSDRRGLALISVLGVVTLATILILALFSVSDSEFKASQIYRDGENARHLADSAVNIVIGQIQAAATGAGTSSSATGPASLGATIWASQPGAVRVYSNTGDFILGRTLYSSSTMVWPGGSMDGERTMASAAPSAAWASSLDQWVDLNRPVERVTAGSTPVVHFPVFDPRATAPVPGNSTNLGIEGFSILPQTTGAKSVSSASLGVSLAGATPDVWRLPMPVEWLYVLKNGSVGTVVQPAGGEGQWAGTSGTAGPSETNPIVGRVGFWTDDECCKININTAGEPGFWSQPNALHDRERSWADSPPAIFEYQRYPGHPATVALSTVLAPGFNPNNYFPPPSVYPQSNLLFKNAIYEFVPKLAIGGTSDGQVPFAPNDLALNSSQKASPQIQALSDAIMAAKKERLYPSIDEALFPSTGGSGLKRIPRVLAGPGSTSLITPDILERARSFLTAQSRAPETNMFGLPRVAMWPVPDSSAPDGSGNFLDYRTGFDTAVALCAKVGSSASGTAALTQTANTYYFRRLNPSSHLTDMGRDPKGSGGTSGLSRNNKLMTYLNNLIHMPMPGGSSFAKKYNKGDAEQILVEIFDYIRCTNLYDGFLSTKTSGGHTDDERRDETLSTKLRTPVTVLWDQTPKRNQYFTYTPPRFTVKRTTNDEGLTGAPTQAANQYNQDPEWVKTGTYPGHGQVKPIEWVDPSTGKTLRGFGRFPTISEVALHFICTADGKPDDGSYKIEIGGKTTISGGKTAERIDRGSPNDRVLIPDQGPNDSQKLGYYFSNIPPFPDASTFHDLWGCNLSKAGTGTKDDPALHPGWRAVNWNCTLDENKSLKEDEKRIQLCLLIETFVPAVGYTRYTPDFTMVLNGDQVSGIKVKDADGIYKSVFSTSGNLVIQSTYTYAGDDRGLNAAHDVSPLGGHFAPSALTTGRQIPGFKRMPKDPSYQDKASNANIHTAMANFPLVSNFLTVKRQNGTQTALIDFQVEKPLTVDIYATHDWQGTQDPANGKPSQTVNIKFPGGSTPVPHLVVYSSERRDYIDSNGNRFTRNAVPAPHWWAFNYGGAIYRYKGSPDVAAARAGAIEWSTQPEPVATAEAELVYGRFHATANTGSVPSQDKGNRGLKSAPNGVNVPCGGLIYGWSSISTYNGVLANPDLDLGNVDVYKIVGTPGDRKMGYYGYYGSDSVRSIIPRHGDYRIFAARKVVDAGVWEKHPVWAGKSGAKRSINSLFAHSLSGAYSDAAVGFDLGGSSDTTSDPKYRLVPGAFYEPNNGTDSDGKTGRLSVIPDTPLSPEAMAGATKYRDFDNGPGNLRDGPYINKPDDGNLSVMKFWHGHGTNDKTGVQAGYYAIRNTYFTSSFLQLPATSAYFTPNRMVSSPGMFGSLPTGVWGSQPPKGNAGQPDIDGIPWRTLLFRADVDGHVGAPELKGQASTGVAPADHYFMDLFFMPIVEPYAITDSYSTAGKINLNYQIVPFTYIRRATAVYAAMKGEMITAYSSVDTDPRKGFAQDPSDTNTVIYKKIKDVNPIPPDLWNEVTDKVYWHREIDVEQTVKQLDERFAFQGNPAAPGSVGLMLAPSQVCELHLIPKIPAGTARAGKLNVPAEPLMSGMDQRTRKNTMRTYWQHNDLTGDNTRERPYANLYQKFTTRSNTFRVYFTAQTLRKARSLLPSHVDTRRDTVTSEFRGSALLVRYLDFSPAGTATLGASDYGNGDSLSGRKSLESFYHYRVIEMKQFSP